MTDFMQRIAKRLADVEIEVKRLRDKDVRKPPLGVVPEYIKDEERLEELQTAIIAYCEQNREICPEWIEEYNILIEFTSK